MTPRSDRMEGLATLIAKARSDAKFFHALIWNTESVLKDVDFLSREEKASLIRFSPEDLIVGLATGRLVPGDPVATCGATCGASCGGSCGATCGASCGASCTTTCSSSCGASCATTGGSTITDPIFDPAERLTEQIRTAIDSQSFSRFQR